VNLGFKNHFLSNKYLFGNVHTEQTKTPHGYKNNSKSRHLDANSNEICNYTVLRGVFKSKIMRQIVLCKHDTLLLQESDTEKTWGRHM